MTTLDKNLKLTIFMTAYNRENYIKNAVESILNQTFQNFHLVVLNNASTDGTLEILQGIKDPRMSIITHEKNIGPIANGNYPYDHLSGDYFMVVHDDDIFLPEAIATEIAFLEKNKDVALVSLSANIIDENGSFLTDRSIPKDILAADTYTKDEYLVNKLCQTKSSVVCPSVMYRTEFFEKNQIRSRSEAGPACDFVFYNEVCFAGGKIGVLKAPLILYREHSGQDSYNNLFNKFDLRDLDTIYSLIEKYGVVTDKSVLSKLLSARAAFWAYRLAYSKKSQNTLSKHIETVKNRRYYNGFCIKDKIVITVGKYMPWAIRFANKIRKMRKRK
ncbi:glycosyltransferase family 2 protein [bacterium]|nr:glycosyltransferase family 2 protein [bacterium]